MAEYFRILRIFPCCVIIMIYFLSPQSSAAASESYFSTLRKKKKEAEDLALWLQPPAKNDFFARPYTCLEVNRKKAVSVGGVDAWLWVADCALCDITYGSL